MPTDRLLLLGDAAGCQWHAEDWTATDDRVRGGKSQSYLTCSRTQAEFRGNLDIQTLGGAGFASQQTTREDRTWDLSNYAGIELIIKTADEKQYTFILKDELLPPNPENGREQSTISYEHDFQVTLSQTHDVATVFVPWDQFKATYRGKERKEAPDLNLRQVRRMSLMMRSFFGNQEGPFSMTLISIAATTFPNSQPARNLQGPKGQVQDNDANEDVSLVKQDLQDQEGKRRGLSWVIAKYFRL